MTHFAVFSPPFFSHIRSFEAIARVLTERGHRVTLVHHPDVALQIRDSALKFHPVGEATHPQGSLAAVVRRAANPKWPAGLLAVIRDVAHATDMLCREGPAAVRAIGAEAVIADQMEAAGGLVAEHLRLPYVSIANAVPINPEPLMPPPFLPWRYDATSRGEHRNRGAERITAQLMRRHAEVIARHATRLGLIHRRSLSDCLSPFGQCAQLVRGIDFPRRRLPETFHYVGPIRSPDIIDGPFHLPGRSERPLVFASLGTLQGSRFHIFRKIAQACRALDLQLLVAHCGALDAERAAAIGATWTIDFAPQRAVLAQADLLVTHAGPTTVMDALSFGIPMLAIPIAFDQPGMAARVVHAGVGEHLSPRLLTAGRVRRALQRLLVDNRYRLRAQALRQEIATSGGVDRVADILERLTAFDQPAAFIAAERNA